MDDLTIKPPPAILLNQAAERLKESRHYLAALTAVRRALAIEPNNPTILGTFGAVNWNSGKFEEGAAALERCTQINPGNANSWAHLALCYASLRRDAETEHAYSQAIAADPDNLAIRWNRANFRLSAGDWERGFDDYEARIGFRGPPLYPKWSYPMWDGRQDLNGKTLVLFGEQGVGDTILSSRYIPLIKSRWPAVRIIWFVQPRLHDLFWDFRDCAEFWPAGHPWPEADYGVFQMSLPKLFGSTPTEVPDEPRKLYRRAALSAKSVRVPEPLTPSLKIGIAWTGNPDMMANDDRSIPLEMLLPLAEDPRYTFYSLQVGPGADHLQFVGCDDLIRDCSRDLDLMGFAGTAALMLNLDLIITVCTSNAHLAGALGVPCWTLLCSDPYWVWGREGESTLWYPGMKLFRQRKAGEWDSVIDDVKAALDRFERVRPALAA